MDIKYEHGFIVVKYNCMSDCRIEVENKTNIRAFSKLFISPDIIYHLDKNRVRRFLFGLVKYRPIPKPEIFVFNQDNVELIFMLTYDDMNTVILVKDGVDIQTTISNKDLREKLINVYESCLAYAEIIK